MAMITRKGAQLHYECFGEGPAILLSHGFTASARMWRPQVGAWPGYRMIAWDARGHGHTSSPDDPNFYSREETVEDMAAILDACAAPTAVVAGMSMGGYMSLAFHLKYPERVQALMLIDTGPGYKNDEARANWNAFAEKRAQGLEEKGFAAVTSTESRDAQHTSAQALAHVARGIMAQQDADVIHSLPNIKVPTLVVVGEKDERFLLPTDYMAAKIPGAKKVVVPNAGHAANMDNAPFFNKAVQDFLAELPA